MRRLTFLGLVLSAGLLAPGCGPTASPTPAAAPGRSDADAKVRDAEKAVAEAAKAQRDEYAREMHKKFDDLDARYRALETRAAAAQGDARRDLDAKVKAAKARRDVAATRLGELKNAGADRWDKVKDGVGSAIDDLSKAFE
jgi:hypothetical protein